MALEAAVQVGAGQRGDQGLEGIQQVVQGQQGLRPRPDNHGLVRRGQDAALSRLAAAWLVLDRFAVPPFQDGFRVDVVALR